VLKGVSLFVDGLRPSTKSLRGEAPHFFCPKAKKEQRGCTAEHFLLMGLGHQQKVLGAKPRTFSAASLEKVLGAKPRTFSAASLEK